MTIRQRGPNTRLDAQAHPGGILCVALSPLSGLIASGGDDKKTCVWTLKSMQKKGKPTVKLSGHASGVTCVAFGPDDRLIASGNFGGGLRVWDFQDEQQQSVKVFPAGHHQTCGCVSFSTDGRFLCTGSHDTSAKIWDIQTRQCLHTYKVHNGVVNNVSMSPDGKYLFTAGGDNTVSLIDLQQEKSIKTFQHNGPATCLSLHPTKTILATGSADRTAKVYDLRNFQQLCDIKQEKTIRQLQFAGNDGAVLCISSEDAIRFCTWEDPYGRGMGGKTLDRLNIPSGKVGAFQVFDEEICTVSAKDTTLTFSAVGNEHIEPWKSSQSEHKHKSGISVQGKYSDWSTGNEDDDYEESSDDDGTLNVKFMNQTYVQIDQAELEQELRKLKMKEEQKKLSEEKEDHDKTEEKEDNDKSEEPKGENESTSSSDEFEDTALNVKVNKEDDSDDIEYTKEWEDDDDEKNDDKLVTPKSDKKVDPKTDEKEGKPRERDTPSPAEESDPIPQGTRRAFVLPKKKEQKPPSTARSQGTPTNSPVPSHAPATAPSQSPQTQQETPKLIPVNTPDLSPIDFNQRAMTKQDLIALAQELNVKIPSNAFDTPLNQIRFEKKLMKIFDKQSTDQPAQLSSTIQKRESRENALAQMENLWENQLKEAKKGELRDKGPTPSEPKVQKKVKPQRVKSEPKFSNLPPPQFPKARPESPNPSPIQPKKVPQTAPKRADRAEQEQPQQPEVVFVPNIESVGVKGLINQVKRGQTELERDRTRGLDDLFVIDSITSSHKSVYDTLCHRNENVTSLVSVYRSSKMKGIIGVLDYDPEFKSDRPENSFCKDNAAIVSFFKVFLSKKSGFGGIISFSDMSRLLPNINTLLRCPNPNEVSTGAEMLKSLLETFENKLKKDESNDDEEQELHNTIHDELADTYATIEAIQPDFSTNKDIRTLLTSVHDTLSSILNY
ncbi:putative POC1 centriolar protein [Blattamonas nauphoetae]|uniref:POC1 centriolar protein n=1 Tax=Blattamonas nauphoetae TaxID=2049346 RepID=A0ABQ9XVT7_9EUKA|nr:putative POC1 centriolar protein [Blattamonas nauphoetae]